MPTKQNPYTEKTQQSREDQLIKHAPLVKRVVTRMAARFPPGVDQEELYQVGMIGLLDAVDKFDPTRDVKFKTYAEFRIKGAILDELRKMDWVPRSVVPTPINTALHGGNCLLNLAVNPVTRKWQGR